MSHRGCCVDRAEPRAGSPEHGAVVVLDPHSWEGKTAQDSSPSRPAATADHQAGSPAPGRAASKRRRAVHRTPHEAALASPPTAAGAGSENAAAPIAAGACRRLAAPTPGSAVHTPAQAASMATSVRSFRRGLPTLHHPRLAVGMDEARGQAPRLTPKRTGK